MPKISYVAVDGTERSIDAVVGDTVMATAVKSGVSGILADCGGNCACGTCHVYIRDQFRSAVGPVNDLEDDTLDLAVTERRDNSRLSCQIEVTENLDGLIVDLPEVQP